MAQISVETNPESGSVLGGNQQSGLSSFGGLEIRAIWKLTMDHGLIQLVFHPLILGFEYRHALLEEALRPENRDSPNRG